MSRNNSIIIKNFFHQLTKSSEMKAKKFQSNLGASDSVDSSRLKKLASDVLTWTLDEMQLLMHGQLKVRAIMAISQSPGSSRANPLLEGQEIWQHTFKLKV